MKASVGALTNLVRALEQGKKALSKIQTVETFEEEADSYKDTFLKRLFSSHQSMNPVNVIQLRDFVIQPETGRGDTRDVGPGSLRVVRLGLRRSKHRIDSHSGIL